MKNNYYTRNNHHTRYDTSRPDAGSFLFYKAESGASYGDFFTLIGVLPCFMPFEGNFTTETLNHSLHRLVLRRFTFSVLPRHGLHGVYAPLCHRVITSWCGYVFGLAVGVHRQLCLAGYVVQDFAETFQRALLVNHARDTL